MEPGLAEAVTEAKACLNKLGKLMWANELVHGMCTLVLAGGDFYDRYHSCPSIHCTYSIYRIPEEFRSRMRPANDRLWELYCASIDIVAEVLADPKDKLLQGRLNDILQEAKQVRTCLLLYTPLLTPSYSAATVS